MPLTWANAEYLKLCVSISEKRIFEMPGFTQDRYIKNKMKSDFEIWRFNKPLEHLSGKKYLRILMLTMADVVWSDDGWESEHTVNAVDMGIGIFVADIKEFNADADKIEFTFYWEVANKWEDKKYAVEIENS